RRATNRLTPPTLPLVQEHHLSELRAPREVLECGASLGHRKGPVYRRNQPSISEFGGNGGELLVVAHGGTEDVPLVPEEAPYIELQVGTGGAAARHQPATARERLQRSAPGRLPYAVHHHIRPAPRATRAHL